MSLNDPRDNSVEQAWNEEISQRAFKARSGNATLLIREEFRKQMRERLG
ncbi:hypothetical protein [Halomonas sp. IOP_14]|jgi:hypothetical protein|nr:hypothetical protein [Halomonas sp. IOP_14]MCE7517613.1 hypothetical protein [Halomonas titanicae]